MISKAATVSGYLSELTPEERADIRKVRGVIKKNLPSGYKEATEKWLKAQYKASGKRLNMGKSCVRFKHADDLPLDLIGEAIARTSVDEYIDAYAKTKKKKAKKR